MHRENIKHWFKLVSKTVVSVLLYFFFLIYTPTIYAVAENIFTGTFFHSRVIILGDTTIRARIFDDHSERKQGLSGTKKLESNHGALFIFEDEDIHGIWMKDMNYPLDIIWLNKHGAVIYFEENISPDTYPKVFEPGKLSKYVIEVNGGFVSKHNLKIGDTIDLY